MPYIQEFQGKFELFLETYRYKTGKELSLDKVEAYLEDALEKKEDKLVNEAFSEMSIIQIQDALSFIRSFKKTKKGKK